MTEQEIKEIQKIKQNAEKASERNIPESHKTFHKLMAELMQTKLDQINKGDAK